MIKRIIVVTLVMALLIASSTVCFATNGKMATVNLEDDRVMFYNNETKHEYVTTESDGCFTITEYINGEIKTQVSGTYGDTELLFSDYSNGNPVTMQLNAEDYIQVSKQEIQEKNLAESAAVTYLTKGRYNYNPYYSNQAGGNVSHVAYFKYRITDTDNISYTINAASGTAVTVVAGSIVGILGGLVTGSIAAAIVIGVVTGAGSHIINGVIESSITEPVSCAATYYDCIYQTEYGLTSTPFEGEKLVVNTRSSAHYNETFYMGTVPEEWKTHAKRIFTLYYLELAPYPGVASYTSY